jgi:hypothetical protein
LPRRNNAAAQGWAISEGRMKKIVFLSLFIVAAASIQPAFAAAPASACAKGSQACHCGSATSPFWKCCSSKLKCDCTGGLPNCHH